MTGSNLSIFTLNSTRDFGTKVCDRLGITLAAHEEREFEDGEHKARPLENVRGKDVFVIQTLYGDASQSVNDKLCRLLFFIGALRDASAARITAVVPYLCYARKDRRTKPRDPVTTRYVAALFEAAGTDGALLLDVHNPAAVQNAWRLPVDHLEARGLFVEHFSAIAGQSDLVVVSPDAGGVKRVEDLRQALVQKLGRDVPSAFVEKYRSGGVVSGNSVVGNVSGRIALVFDDLISSGTTMSRAAEACMAKGAKAVYAAATHGVFSSQADATLSNPAITGIAITNSIAVSPSTLPGIANRLSVLDVSAMFATAIERMHSGGSIAGLLQ